MTATELYQEGLVIPPVKLFDAGRENKTLIDMIRANVRSPEIFMGDLRAQEGAAQRRTAPADLLERYGFDGVSQAMELLDRICREESARRDHANSQRRV